jgi:Cu(I)/Ag(I) efflux system membrane protein CusA/SilA
MSLGGIALAIGELVDTSIVMVDNAYRRLAEPRSDGTPVPYDEQPREVVSAAQQVGRALFFSLAIIIVSFLPVFLLEAQEGRMFRPLAWTKTFAMMFATLLAVTLVPVLMTIFVGGRGLRPESANPISRGLMRLYEPVLRVALRWRWSALLVNALVIPATIPLLFVIGSEFMPPLYEGSLLYMPTAPPGMSITEGARVMQVQDKVIRQFPEVETVFGTIGRATTATDNSPMGMVNTTIVLKPRDAWRPGMTVEKLQAEMDEALQFAGFPNTWTQPIRNRLDMLFTGIKTPVGIKILGPDLAVIQQLGSRIERILQAVPETRSVYAERVTQGYFTDIRVRRDAIARHGLTVGEVQDVVQAAIGGMTVTRTVEGRERYPVNVRYERAFRDDLPALGRVLVKTPSGAQVPLAQLADIELVEGPAMIRDENGQLAGYVYVDTATRDIGGYVAAARAAIGRELQVPPGYTLQWTGQFEYQVRARERLRILVPVVLFVIFVLLHMAFRSASEAVIVMLSVLYAMTGGVILQWWLGYNFSVAVWVGYIALYGVAVQTGVVMVVYLHEALDRRLHGGGAVTEESLLEATVEGSVLRLRPKIMTVGTTLVSLAPIMWATGVGADVMKPMAAPILGGMITSTIHVLIVTPVIFYLMKRRALRRGTLQPSEMGEFV